jgi:hypothetical protein
MDHAGLELNRTELHDEGEISDGKRQTAAPNPFVKVERNRRVNKRLSFSSGFWQFPSFAAAFSDIADPAKRTVRRLLAELLEPRCLLSAETGSSLLFSGIAPSPISSTNSGLLIAADVASGLAAPLHAPFSSVEDRANGWNLPLNAGFSGLAFGPAAQQLFGAASSGPQSASNLLTMDPYTGVQKVAPVPIRAAAQALHISDLATVPGGTYQLYGLGRPVGTPSATFQLYVIDPGSGQAVAIADQPAWLASLSSADALAFGPDGTLYVGGQERSEMLRCCTSSSQTAAIPW